ncbi:unnamed protein product [Alopecurus aequalis]
MLGWRATGARVVLRRLRAATAAAEKQDGRVFAASYSSISSTMANTLFGLGQYTNLLRAHTCTSRGIPFNCHQLIHNAGISTTRNLLAADNAMVPVSSPLTAPLRDAEETDKKGAVVKKLKVQDIKKDIKQSPKKVNLVAKLVLGMRVEDALLQLQVTVKRAAKTLYHVRNSSYQSLQEANPEAKLRVSNYKKIAKLRVSNYKKLTRKEKQLMPHRLMEVSPKWARKLKEEAGDRA